MRRFYIAATPQKKGFFAQLVRILLFLGLLVIGAMLSVVALSIVLVLGLGLWGFVWWKTRAIRAALRQAKAYAERSPEQQQHPTQAEQTTTTSGVVIEGEVIRREK